MQAKHRIGPVNDPLEREADRVADAVVRGEPVGAVKRAPAAPQRMCAECEAEEGDESTLQRKCAGCGGGEGHASADAAARAVSSGGAPLSPRLRAYFEPRFGRDLSQVRIHTNAGAASAARGIGARAYTLGSNIAFAAGEYEPASPAGQQLMAHELAHVAQQGETAPQTVRRAVAGTSNCPPNVNGAGANSIADLTDADARAQLMSLGTAYVLAAEAITFADPAFGPSDVSVAYQRRFGFPGPTAAGRFFNRLTGTTHATRDAAIAGEMERMSARFSGVNRLLSGPIRYRCTGAAAITLPGCAAKGCDPDENAFACPGGTQMGICPAFWNAADMQDANPRAATIIHEAVHMWLGVFPHDRVGGRRLGNPECLAAFVADLYGFAHNDQADCAGLIP